MATLLKSRAGAAKLGVPLMITSFLVVAGFMYWLSVTAKPTEIMWPDPDDVFENVVTLQDFSTGPGGYVGQMISLEDIEIVAFFGNHGRWINLTDQNRNGYLFHFSDSLRADTTVVLSSIVEGMSVSVTGMVVETVDSILDAWEAAGAFTSPLDRLLAQGTYHLSFIEVTRIELPETSPPGQDDGLGSG
jgi:hypothetical protein